MFFPLVTVTVLIVGSPTLVTHWYNHVLHSSLFWRKIDIRGEFHGIFENDRKNGPGRLHLPCGTIIHGCWKEGVLVDTVNCEFPQGSAWNNPAYWLDRTLPVVTTQHVFLHDGVHPFRPHSQILFCVTTDVHSEDITAKISFEYALEQSTVL